MIYLCMAGDTEPIIQHLRLQWRTTERTRRYMLAAFDGAVEDLDYGAGVTIRALLPEEKSEAFRERIFDVSGGTIRARVTGESHRAVPL